MVSELTPAELEAIADLDAEIAAMDAEAEQRIEATQQDPTQQSYFLRMDDKTVVQTQAEYDYCTEHRVPMKIVSFNSAVDHLNKEVAAKRALAKKRKQTKTARKQAQLNRKKR